MSVRILHVATRHRVGGAERNLLHTVARQLDREFQVHVAVGTEDLELDFPPRTRIHPLPCLVREVAPGCDRRAVRDVRALVRDHGFDVVHTHQSKAGAVGRLASRALAPIIVHTVHMASFGPAYGRVQSAVFLALERRLARFTDMFVFVGTDLQRRYAAAGVAAPDRSTVIRSPIVNLESLIALRECRNQQKGRARAAIGIPGERRVILMVGALDPRKRHGLALTTLAPLLRQGKTQVLIAGQGPERHAIEVLCRRLGVSDAIQLLGFVADVTPLYAAADVFVQASALEGLPQTIVQAIAAGLPVIATEVDGVREVASHPPHVTILPPDGQGLLAAVRARLSATDFSPAAPELVTDWRSDVVDAHLDRLHDWIEHRLGHRQRPAPRAGARVTGRPAVSQPTEKLATR
jgi:glycosyltransferase involved in cell wall biosynthesis